MLASNSAESAEVAELEEETADELAKEVGGKGKGRAQGSPDLDEGRSITLKPSRPTLTQIFTVGPGPLLGTLLHVQKSEAHLLVAVLHAAVPLKQVHGITKLSLFGVVTLLHSQELEAHLLVTALNTAVPQRGTQQCQELEAHLLVAALHAAVPLKEVHGISKLVSKDLDFNVARSLDEPLQQNALISKGCSSLPFG